jgi:hypothetical protein
LSFSRTALEDRFGTNAANAQGMAGKTVVLI